MADFALGWAGIDFAGDDGRTFGLWPWQMDEASKGLPPVPAERRREEQKPEAPEAQRQKRKAPTPPKRGGKKLPELDPRLQGLP